MGEPVYAALGVTSALLLAIANTLLDFILRRILIIRQYMILDYLCPTLLRFLRFLLTPTNVALHPDEVLSLVYQGMNVFFVLGMLMPFFVLGVWRLHNYLQAIMFKADDTD